MGKVVVPVQAILGSKWRFQDLLLLRCHCRQQWEMRRKVRYRRSTKFPCEGRRRTVVDSRARMAWVSIKGTLIQEATEAARQIKVKIERSMLA